MTLLFGEWLARKISLDFAISMRTAKAGSVLMVFSQSALSLLAAAVRIVLFLRFYLVMMVLAIILPLCKSSDIYIFQIRYRVFSHYMRFQVSWKLLLHCMNDRMGMLGMRFATTRRKIPFLIACSRDQTIFLRMQESDVRSFVPP